MPLEAGGVRAAAPAVDPAHPLGVRVTHWLHTGLFVLLCVSGVAILLAHPRLYWGEVGNIETPSLVDLPLPTLLTGQSGWGRSLHFLSAWLFVFTGAGYVVPALRRGGIAAAAHYGWLQRRAYVGVVLGLAPAMVATGLAMSPALAAVWPWLVGGFGGQQSARTLHFAGACLLVLFAAGHVLMVWRAGFVRQMTAMTVGRPRRRVVAG